MTLGQLARKPLGTARSGYGATARGDRWWLPPWTAAAVLTIFVAWSLFSAFLLTPFTGVPFEVDGYVSPLFASHTAPDWFPEWLTPAIITLWIPFAFRASCYYFRRTAYRAFLADPPACATGEPPVHRRYTMEAGLPLILQNLHRYALYLALIPAAIGWIDAVAAFSYEGALRIGLGGILLLTESILLTGYVLSCHSVRHLVGGRIDCYSCTRRTRVRHGLWRWLSALNGNHGLWFWSSLAFIVVCDVYIRALAVGIVTDPAIIIAR